MRIVWIVLSLLACSLAPAEAQTYGNRGECPPNTRPKGAFCQLNIPDTFRNRGSCPDEYVSTADGAYCVLAPRKEWVRTKLGCPSGFEQSPGGEFCIAR